MSELRWTLLVLGVVFIAALSWWERRRPRQAFAPHLREARLPRDDAPRPTAGPAEGAEPWIGEDGLADVVSSDMTLTDTEEEGGATYDRAADTRVRAPAPGPFEDLPIVIADADERIALAAVWNEQPPEPRLIDPEDTGTGELPVLPFDPEESSDVMEAIDDMEPSEPSPVPEIAGAEGVGTVRIVEPAANGEGSAPVEVIVEWPPEASRRILALRLVAPQARFAGRTLRLALAAEGFLLGKFSIFHKPDEGNRALLSAASLNRPGSFNLETMDSQRYGGLSLFVVLPGLRTPQQAFEELLIAARNLNERLEGALQDERGGPLTQLRVATIREGLRTEAGASLPPAAAHGA
ncbi:MAG TPA: cell division protein ZipA C-terminal FtsZ-binding domain-containing protein [Steroidobacteraceae bacterium]